MQPCCPSRRTGLPRKKQRPELAAGDQEYIEQAALRLLAGREHCSAELCRKLRARGYSADAIDRVSTGLRERGLLSDERFVEGYVEERTRKGFGPLRIRAELMERGVGEALIERFLVRDDDLWMERMEAACRRKYADPAPSERCELARRARFLEYRGFTPAQVSRFLKFDD